MALTLRMRVVVVVTGVMNQVGEIHTWVRKVLGQVPVDKTGEFSGTITEYRERRVM